MSDNDFIDMMRDMLDDFGTRLRELEQKFAVAEQRQLDREKQKEQSKIIPRIIIASILTSLIGFAGAKLYELEQYIVREKIKSENKSTNN